MLAIPPAKETFQYRVVVNGETMRHIAPAEDLEILDAMTEVVCFRCQYVFRTKPGVLDKAAGRCQCGGWICPACLACQTAETSEQSPVLKATQAYGKKTGQREKRQTSLTDSNLNC